MSARSLENVGVITKIIFLVARQISVYEAEKWSFDNLRFEGFEVEVLDLGKLLNRSIVDSLTRSVKDPLVGGFIHSPDSWREFEKLVFNWSPNALFIDYVVGASDVTLRESSVFRIFKNHRVRYCFVLSGALPMPSSIQTSFTGKIKVFRSRLNKAFKHPSKLLNFISSKIIIFLTRRKLFYPLPAIIFGGNSPVLNQFVAKRNFDTTRIVPVHSLDYDANIIFRRNLSGELPSSENMCVFLDEAATHHSDYYFIGLRPANAEKYFPAMNELFDAIEKKLGLNVVIAAHPRSNYEGMLDVFRGRHVVKGRTQELVARCRLVVMHASTSLSYAVLFRKPVLPVYIPGMVLSNTVNLMVDVMSAAIGSSPLNLENDELLTSALQRSCDLDKYIEYESRYIKSLGLGELETWKIITKTLKAAR